MIPRRYPYWSLLLLFVGAPCALTQGFRIDWYTIDGGGGTSTGGTYELSGTIGQPDASSQPLTGNGYELSGGFWPGWIVPSDNGLPTLFIQHTPEGVIVSWPPAAGAVSLQETSEVSGNSWQPSAVVNGQPVVPADRTMFYRLVR